MICTVHSPDTCFLRTHHVQVSRSHRVHVGHPLGYISLLVYYYTWEMYVVLCYTCFQNGTRFLKNKRTNLTLRVGVLRYVHPVSVHTFPTLYVRAYIMYQTKTQTQ